VVSSISVMEIEEIRASFDRPVPSIYIGEEPMVMPLDTSCWLPITSYTLTVLGLENVTRLATSLPVKTLVFPWL